MIYSPVGDSLARVRFELSQLRHLLRIVDKGIRAALAEFHVEIAQARRVPGAYSDPLAYQRDDDDVSALIDLDRYENYTALIALCSPSSVEKSVPCP